MEFVKGKKRAEISNAIDAFVTGVVGQVVGLWNRYMDRQINKIQNFN